MFLGEGAAQNGRMAETLNAAAKEKLPLLFLVIDNGRAINTFTPDVAINSDVFLQVRYCRSPAIDCSFDAMTVIQGWLLLVVTFALVLPLVFGVGAGARIVFPSSYREQQRRFILTKVRCHWWFGLLILLPPFTLFFCRISALVFV